MVLIVIPNIVLVQSYSSKNEFWSMESADRMSAIAALETSTSTRQELLRRPLCLQKFDLCCGINIDPLTDA
jgi:hypothetical protein